MNRRRRPMLIVAALTLLALAATACAIPTQSGPVAINSTKVPFNLLNPHLPTTTTTQPKSYLSVTVFFIDSTDQLVPSTRYVASPAPLDSVLAALLAGPSPVEAANVTTAIPSDVTVLSTSTQPGNVVLVNMNSAFDDITGTDTELAVGQIVSTVATAVGFGTGVIFEIDGQRTSVPIANGSQVAGPVYLLDFINVAS